MFPMVTGFMNYGKQTIRKLDKVS
nr:NADH-plastoquinone oxidoreductase subunit I [Phragmipedium besseae]YP_010178467.1 NADH-plastoquinone oxidoreductase subunit I [Phragmipedium kovachii]QUV74418.1 NADH-plastoquinone oxidoreductase subunit I [Phragmipedium besseae]QUV74496.1 NADH-plastoquinone oxidoreductase subunit I [Phragmipedium kovachii]